MTVDLYEIKSKAYLLIHRVAEKLNIDKYPYEFAWITYALSFEENKLETHLKLLKKLEKWSISPLAGKRSKDLGALSLCYALTSMEDIKTSIITKSNLILRNIKPGILSKFSVLNDSIQIFCFSLDLIQNFKDHIELIKSNALRGLRSNFTRKIFSSAILNKLKASNTLVIEENEITQNKEKIYYLWYIKKYTELSEKDTILMLQFLKEIESILELKLMRNENSFSLTCIELALLIEYLVKELAQISPLILLSNLPLHPQIERIAKDYFTNNKYATSVFESIKKFIEYIREITNINEISEVRLVQIAFSPWKRVNNKRVYKLSSEIPILFNHNYDDDISVKNFQDGLYMLTEGLVKAFRHPKGHKPEDHELVDIDAFEALDQLTLISYLWKRVEKSRIIRLE